MPDAASDLTARYEALQRAAIEANHQVRVVVIPGAELKAGQSLTVKPIDVDPMSLPAALDWAEKYVASDEAVARGNLYRDRDEKRALYMASIQAENDLRKAWKAAEEAIEADTDQAAFPDEQADPVPQKTVTAGLIRRTFRRHPDASARAILTRIEGLDDDAEVTLEPDDDIPPGVGVEFTQS